MKLSVRKLVWSSLVVFCVASVAAVAWWNTQPTAPRDPRPEVQRLYEAIEKLAPLQKPLPPPRPGDWLAEHEELGQTFEQYLESHRTPLPTNQRVLYVQPLGEFNEPQREVIRSAAEFLHLYFNLPVAVQEDLPLSLVPEHARRTHPTWGDRQILTTYVLDEILAPRIPDDAAACIAFTAVDLWPGDDWNFVVGQASRRHHVGIWSIFRHGDPAQGEEAFRECLLRTLKTATHETGHMLGLKHCIAHECDMCGSNSLKESERRPLHLCSECVAKVCWMTSADPVERYQRLAEFCRGRGYHDEQRFYEQAAVLCR